MLHYIGDGAALPDVPGRDLSDDELLAIASRDGWHIGIDDPVAAVREWLILSGLYVAKEES